MAQQRNTSQRKRSSQGSQQPGRRGRKGQQIIQRQGGDRNEKGQDRRERNPR